MVAADAHHAEPPASSSRVEVVGVSRSKVATARNERTPLLAKPEEEVYPLPWFRSPEWTRRPPPPARNPGRRRQGGASKRTAACPPALLCCYSSSASDAGSESDVELGYLVRRPANASEADDEADSFKQCIQFLVGLIVIMAMALILLIIFQPKPDGSR
ncbi:glutamine-trna ligase [Phytophthora cinnamomi]|uniref:glutamine-trna ligase n=1 Tax=Phytophthora cinnamomi TaxID=4785 RepID=UPI003559FD75|nr:glutamine-trna ligase [Phytophthora cinnamomi]